MSNMLGTVHTKNIIRSEKVQRILHDPKALKIIALVLAAIISMTVVSPIMSNPATHAGTLALLSQNKHEALTITGLVTISSTALSCLPEDAASPLAEELAELAGPLFLITTFLYLEQFLAAA